MPKPRTVKQAVERLVLLWPDEELRHVRGMKDSSRDYELRHGLLVQIQLMRGLLGDNGVLLRDCGVSDPESAAETILDELYRHLVETSSPELLRESREYRRKREIEIAASREPMLQHEAEIDSEITDRVCPECGQPCPVYRKTCKRCHFEIGRQLS